MFVLSIIQLKNTNMVTEEQDSTSITGKVKHAVEFTSPQYIFPTITVNDFGCLVY